jgi:hypothetical protein
MDSIVPGPGFVSNYVLLLAVRQLLVYLTWVLIAALAGAAACWCCGYGAQAAWSRAASARRAWRAATRSGRSDAVTEEAARGIHEIEEYLAMHSAILPRAQRVDEEEQ